MTLVGVLKILLRRDDDEVDQTLQNFFCKMFLIGRTVCFILAILFTIVAVITNSQNNTRRVPPPKPFFTHNTWVEDFYEGELYYALLKATKYDVIFLMLYAPWDADSQNARSEFETACRYFRNKVYCAAINCWQANAGCKALFDNIVMYPVFLADLHNLPSIKYHGEIVASHMIRFLASIIKPIERIYSFEKFVAMKSTCDALTISFLSDYKWYKKYYTASLRFLEYDPRREVCWSFITNEHLAKSLDVSDSSVKIYLWNETKEFNNSFTSKNIVRWVRENVLLMTQWMFFTNARSNRLADLVQNNPAVILFTPRNLYLDHVPTYLMFREAVMEFKNCFSRTSSDEHLSFIAKSRRKIIEDFEHWEQVCNSRFQFKSSIFNSKILNIINGDFGLMHYSDVSNVFCNNGSYFHRISYPDGLKKSLFHTSNLDDGRSPQNLVLDYVHEHCRQHNMFKKSYRYSHFFSKFVHQNIDDWLRSKLCRLNDTYNFFAVDSLLYSHFASVLGIDLKKYKDMTTIVILDSKKEEVFVSSDEFNSKQSLHEFMISTVNHTAPRWMKSTADASIYLHRYNNLNNLIPNQLAVLELNSESFHVEVFNSSSNAVIYYYSPYCSYCQVAAHIFLSVANMLRNYTQVTFARIDGENNDLRWHLVPQSYPTIILFPTGRKAESMVFPPSRELTIENLLDFVLLNIEPEVRISYETDLCIQLSKIANSTNGDFLDCVEMVKTDCIGVINDIVTKYQRLSSDISLNTNSSITRDTFLRRLKHLKSFYVRLDDMFET